MVMPSRPLQPIVVGSRCVSFILPTQRIGLLSRVHTHTARGNSESPSKVVVAAAATVGIGSGWAHQAPTGVAIPCVELSVDTVGRLGRRLASITTFDRGKGA